MKCYFHIGVLLIHWNITYTFLFTQVITKPSIFMCSCELIRSDLKTTADIVFSEIIINHL